MHTAEGKRTEQEALATPVSQSTPGSRRGGAGDQQDCQKSLPSKGELRTPRTPKPAEAAERGGGGRRGAAEWPGKTTRSHSRPGR